MYTFYQMWGVTQPEEARRIIESQRREAVMENPANLEEQAICLVGRDVYATLIKGYTEKQWGRACTELPASIIKRLPVRFTFDNNYFNDRYQGIPVGGYNVLIKGLLDGIEWRTGCNYLDDRAYFDGLADEIVYTGPIDEYFGWSLGFLEYRSLRFEQEMLPVSNYQGNAIVNYTERTVPYTRIVEHKHFEPGNGAVLSLPYTVVTGNIRRIIRPEVRRITLWTTSGIGICMRLIRTWGDVMCPIHGLRGDSAHINMWIWGRPYRLL